jgi:hypothetical protein
MIGQFADRQAGVSWQIRSSAGGANQNQIRVVRATV